jgi:nucleoside phosphorylase
MFVCAGENEQFSFAAPVGTGLTASAINMTRLAILDRPDFIIFIGTAGSYGKKNILDIVESKTAVNIEHGLLTNSAYTPIDNAVSTSPDPDKDIVVNSSNYITTSPEISKLYLQKNIDLENMEFYSVLAVAKKFNIPASGIFVVTNYCDNSAHSSFLSNHNEAMLKLEKFIREKKYQNESK